jgi:hypothetical protein
MPATTHHGATKATQLTPQHTSRVKQRALLHDKSTRAASPYTRWPSGAWFLTASTADLLPCAVLSTPFLVVSAALSMARSRSSARPAALLAASLATFLAGPAETTGPARHGSRFSHKSRSYAVSDVCCRVPALCVPHAAPMSQASCISTQSTLQSTHQSVSRL